MDQADLELEQRVWQRVAGGSVEADNRCGLRCLMLRAEDASAVYHHLAVHSTGSRREKLQKLSREAAENGAMIRGMMMLSGEEAPRRGTAPVSGHGSTRILAEAYRASCRTRRDYAAMEKHEEYGCIFRAMGKQEEAHMAVLLELIGNEHSARA